MTATPTTLLKRVESEQGRPQLEASHFVRFVQYMRCNAKRKTAFRNTARKLRNVVCHVDVPEALLM